MLNYNGLGYGEMEMQDDFSLEMPPMLGNEIGAFTDSLHKYVHNSRELAKHSSDLVRFLQHTRDAYNNAVRERDLLYSQLKTKLEKLQKCEVTLQRYEVASDPVVASDGYTYERDEIVGYIDECKGSGKPAFSEQTKEQLTDRVVSNLSLISLTKELMGAIKPDFNVLPEYLPRTHIEPYTTTTSSAGRGGAWEETGKTVPSTSNGHNNSNRVRGGGRGNGENSGAGHSGVGSSGPGARRFDPSVGHASNQMKDGGQDDTGAVKQDLHPCLRIYHCCNFKDDCMFANYPYEACLNHIKGKCRFGNQCKELHVDRDDPQFLNPRSSGTAQQETRMDQTEKKSSSVELNTNTPREETEVKEKTDGEA